MNDHPQPPQEILRQIWSELSCATQERDHAWRTPVMATSGLDGEVNARTVVLRAVDVQTKQLQIFTDARSCKANEIAAQPNALFVFWSAQLSWQLRVRVRTTLLTAGSQVEQLWKQVKQTSSASDYLSASAPGTPIPADDESLNRVDQPANFAVLNAEVLEMDWLELARSGHRRAKIKHDVWQWLVP